MFRKKLIKMLKKFEGNKLQKIFFILLFHLDGSSNEKTGIEAMLVDTNSAFLPF